MKVLGLIVLLCAVAAYAEPQERSLIDIGSIVSKVGGLIKGTSGDIPVPGSTTVVHYDVSRCHIKVGKRFIHGLKHLVDKVKDVATHVVHEDCKAVVSIKGTNYSQSCTKHDQKAAVECATALLEKSLVG